MAFAKKQLNLFSPNFVTFKTLFTGFLLGIFFWGGGQNLLLCKFLLLFYCFRTKFQGGAKVFKGGKTASGGRPPVGESQL